MSGIRDLRFDSLLRERVRAHLAGFERREVAPQGRRAAAVAVVLLGDHEGQASFLLTRRAAQLRAHASQYALPGGSVDPGERPEEAALRELREELGLDLPGSSVLGRLDDYATRSGFIIAPVVLWAGGPVELSPNPEEVAGVFRVSLHELDQPGVPRLIAIPESDRPVIQIPILGTMVHAPTAAVLYQLREVAIHGRATRVDHLEQPVFAWR